MEDLGCTLPTCGLSMDWPPLTWSCNFAIWAVALCVAAVAVNRFSCWWLSSFTCTVHMFPWPVNPTTPLLRAERAAHNLAVAALLGYVLI